VGRGLRPHHGRGRGSHPVRGDPPGSAVPVLRLVGGYPVADRPTFYVDRCLGKAVANALRAAGADVQIHDDHFAQAALDEDWIPRVADQGWVILTKDKNIRRRRGEREAVLTANARVFTLSSGNMRGADMAAL